MEQNFEKYNYKLSPLQSTLMIIVALAIPISFLYLAATNNKASRIIGILNASPEATTKIFWLLFLAGIAVLILVIWFTFITTSRQLGYVALGSTHLITPKASLSGGVFIIPYTSITNISKTKITNTQSMIIIQSAQGESRLISSCFDSELNFESFAISLKKRASL